MQGRPQIMKLDEKHNKVAVAYCASMILRLASLGCLIAFWSLGLEWALAQEPQVKQFSIVVQEKTIKLLSEPKKEVTVWAYGLKGQEPSVPGPTIRVKLGDRVRVDFTNTHRLPHTIHFHGTHPFEADGNGLRALGKEQLQLPGESHAYEFVAAEPGYFLYHCHFDTRNHIDHGMYGLLIVEDPAWPAVDREIITFWDEWDLDGDGRYETHTINSRSAPDFDPLTAQIGEKVRLVLVNIGFELHTPHLHGQRWTLMDPGDPGRVLSTNHNGVVSLAPAEIKIVEFVPAHPGTWLFHCHVVPHVDDDGAYPRGMLTIMKVAPLGEQDLSAKTSSAQTRHVPEDTDSSQTRMLDQIATVIGEPHRGFDLYGAKCQSCHGAFAAGEYGPGLAGNPVLHEPRRFWTTVLEGRGGRMPAWKDSLVPQDIADILAWLKSLESSE